MRCFVCAVGFFLSLLICREFSEAVVRGGGQASSPPRGWNSYDSFLWTISEATFLRNAEIVSKKLLPYGYEYVVVDYLWYRRNTMGAYENSYGYDVLDEWGRVVPDPGRWPSSVGGKGFKEVADKVHAMGLKFGIHVMRGMSLQAFNGNTPILDVIKGGAYKEDNRQWGAKDIGLIEKKCGWMDNGFMSVNTAMGAGKAFLRSLYQQYADWGVDFVKHDCIFGEDLNIDEISFVSETLKELDRPILYSLSPGKFATPAMAQDVSGMVNMYRITADDWDTWADVESHFDISRDMAAARLIGAEGLRGNSWPDLDMLPLGWLTEVGSKQGPNRRCGLTLDEQRTQMTLWSMARSPLMFGGDLRQLDGTTYNLITHPTLLEINSFSTNNMEFPHINARKAHSALIQSSRSTMNISADTVGVLGLTSCMDSKAIGWVDESEKQGLDKICWKPDMESNGNRSFCLHKRKPLLTSDEEVNYLKQNHGKFQLLAAERMDFCLDSSMRRKVTAVEQTSNSFSECKWNSNQF
ncbi:hypothetical protein QJS10_CPA02g00156 [Acorus calamus]|uniref:Alpha-galactosidase n=1 Tax=Acorus calamus TaxID=4465 RepID=A0AAV9FDS3_ACOCL|nr:hypothetical protein QJS10_CPA02g00156 [Acorus calamus]